VAVRTPPVTVPPAPSELRAVAVSPTLIKLTWEDNSDTEDGFRLLYPQSSKTMLGLHGRYTTLAS